MNKNEHKKEDFMGNLFNSLTDEIDFMLIQLMTNSLTYEYYKKILRDQKKELNELLEMIPILKKELKNEFDYNSTKIKDCYEIAIKKFLSRIGMNEQNSETLPKKCPYSLDGLLK
jgi:hypothetical protein